MKKALISIILLLIFGFLANYFLTSDYRELFDGWMSTPKLERPINQSKVEEIIRNKDVINSISKEYNVDPFAVAGVILAEGSLHVGPTNYFEEYYVKTFFLSKSVDYLERLAGATEKELTERRLDGESEQEFQFRVKKGLIWSIGLCQMSILKAKEIEFELAMFANREQRNIKEIIEALFVAEESIRYCAFHLLQIQKIYKEEAGIVINKSPEILATLYNTGNVREKAKKYSSGFHKPKTNEFGDYVQLHLDLIKKIMSSD